MTTDTVEAAFTEFRLPHGSKHEVMLPLPRDAADKAAQLAERGYSLTCEVLGTGDGVFYITDDKHEADADMVIIFARTPVEERMPKVAEFIKAFDVDAYESKRSADDA